MYDIIFNTLIMAGLLSVALDISVFVKLKKEYPSLYESLGRPGYFYTRNKYKVVWDLIVKNGYRNENFEHDMVKLCLLFRYSLILTFVGFIILILLSGSIR